MITENVDGFFNFCLKIRIVKTRESKFIPAVHIAVIIFTYIFILFWTVTIID